MLGRVRSSREGVCDEKDFRRIADSRRGVAGRLALAAALTLAAALAALVPTALAAVLDPAGTSAWLATEYMPPRSSQTLDGARNWGTRVLDVPLAGG